VYIIAARSLVLVDSVHGPGNDYLGAGDDVLIANLSAFSVDIGDGDVISRDVILGPPDGNCVAMGELGMFGWAMVYNSLPGQT